MGVFSTYMVMENARNPADLKVSYIHANSNCHLCNRLNRLDSITACSIQSSSISVLVAAALLCTVRGYHSAVTRKICWFYCC
jgi:hypothetical protein